jgi:hypothetical protein
MKRENIGHGHEKARPVKIKDRRQVSFAFLPASGKTAPVLKAYRGSFILLATVLAQHAAFPIHGG